MEGMPEHSPQDPRWDVAEHAASILAPESELFAKLDMVGFGQAMLQALRGAGANPAVTSGAALRLAGDLARVPLVAMSRWLAGAFDLLRANDLIFNYVATTG